MKIYEDTFRMPNGDMKRIKAWKLSGKYMAALYSFQPSQKWKKDRWTGWTSTREDLQLGIDGICETLENEYGKFDKTQYTEIHIDYTNHTYFVPADKLKIVEETLGKIMEEDDDKSECKSLG